jgi:hypothetical protein
MRAFSEEGAYEEVIVEAILGISPIHGLYLR